MLRAAAIVFAMTATFVQAEEWTPAQIRQIEEIAQDIARQSNASKEAMLNPMTASFQATASGRNVRFEIVLRIQKGLSPAKIREWYQDTQNELVPQVCKTNALNPAFARGLSYTFSYTNTHGEKLGAFLIDKLTCSGFGY